MPLGEAPLAPMRVAGALASGEGAVWLFLTTLTAGGVCQAPLPCPSVRGAPYTDLGTLIGGGDPD